MHSYFVHNLKQALEPSHLIEILQSFGKYDKKLKQDLSWCSKGNKIVKLEMCFLAQ
jgi:hypothetical protein